MFKVILFEKSYFFFEVLGRKDNAKLDQPEQQDKKPMASH